MFIMFIIFIMLKKMVNPLDPHVPPHSFVVRFNQALGHEDWFLREALATLGFDQT